jgi:AraC-like DNA-binding protein
MRPLRAGPRPAGPHRATVAAGFVTGLLAGLAERGLDRNGPLDAAGIDAAVLRDPRARVPLPAYAALYDAIIRAHGDEGFALFASPLRPGTFEFLCRSVVGARRLDEALDRAARFLAVVLPELHVTIERDRDRARLVIAEIHPLRPRPADPCRVFAFEWLLRLLHALACWLVGRGLTLQSVRFPYPRPAHATDYALIYTEHSRFGGAALEADFSPHLLDLPVRRDEEALAAFLAGGPGKITMLYRRDRETVRRVRDLLVAALPESPSLDDAARELGLTPRTLHRRLHEEGSSFRSVKDALRRDLALTQLEKSTRPVAAIAADLGYAEPSAFFRAFQAWTGEAPTAYRRRIAAK